MSGGASVHVLAARGTEGGGGAVEYSVQVGELAVSVGVASAEAGRWRPAFTLSRQAAVLLSGVSKYEGQA